eukprot:364916-Chlamydomonas_euryale.AAC.2
MSRAVSMSLAAGCCICAMYLSRIEAVLEPYRVNTAARVLRTPAVRAASPCCRGCSPTAAGVAASLAAGAATHPYTHTLLSLLFTLAFLEAITFTHTSAGAAFPPFFTLYFGFFRRKIFHIFCCQITMIAKSTSNQTQTWIKAFPGYQAAH